jgi:hypothetical protein
MALNYDLCLVGDDLYIDPETGDFAIWASDEQHIRDTLIAFPGWYKQNPTDGVGLFGYQKSSGQQQVLARNIRQQLQSDGYQCNNPIIMQDSSGLLTVNPNAIKA